MTTDQKIDALIEFLNDPNFIKELYLRMNQHLKDYWDGDVPIEFLSIGLDVKDQFFIGEKYTLEGGKKHSVYVNMEDLKK